MKTFEHLKDYIKHRIDIVCNNPEWWMNYSKNELPSFDYYIEHCVNDKGGKYDFTVRRYKTHTEHLKKINRVGHKERYIDNKTITRKVEYSIWMNTPFNFKEIITL